MVEAPSRRRQSGGRSEARQRVEAASFVGRSGRFYMHKVFFNYPSQRLAFDHVAFQGGLGSKFEAGGGRDPEVIHSPSKGVWLAWSCHRCSAGLARRLGAASEVQGLCLRVVPWHVGNSQNFEFGRPLRFHGTEFRFSWHAPTCSPIACAGAASGSSDTFEPLEGLENHWSHLVIAPCQSTRRPRLLHHRRRKTLETRRAQDRLRVSCLVPGVEQNSSHQGFANVHPRSNDIEG